MKNITTKRASILLAVLLLAFYVQAQITAKQAIVAMERGINLGNTFDAPNEGDWTGGVKTQEYYFDMYKEAGFKTVRIPITWSNHLATTAPFTINATFLSRVEEVVNWGLERDLFVIINAHHEEWIKNTETFDAQKQRFYTLWEQLSERFKDYPEKLCFEILNEPHFEVGDVSKSITQSQLDELNRETLAIIRAKNPTRITIYGGIQYSNSPDLLNAAIPNPQDAYLMGYFHSYDPWPFAGEFKGTWGTATDVQAMITKFDGIQTWSNLNNIPVLVGEFGARRECDYNSRMLYYSIYTEQALKHGFAFTVWDDNGWFQILQRNNAKWNDMKDIIIHTSDSSITGLKLKTVDDTAVQVSWTSRANPDLLEKVLIEKRMLNTEFAVVGELTQVTGTTFIDRITVPSQESYYRVLEVYANDTIPSYPAKILRVATERSAYLGTPVALPGIIQVEDYDIGGEMFTFHDSDFENQGNYYRTDGVDIRKSGSMFYVYNVEVGEWMEYAIDVAKTATYTVTAYMASVDGGGKMQLAFGNVKTPLMVASKTSSATGMQAVTTTVNLVQGPQVMRMNIMAIPSYSIDRIEFSEYISVNETKKEVLKVYPSLVSDQLNIELTGELINNVCIYNSFGQLLINKKIGSEKATIDVADLLAGFYVIVLETKSSLLKASFVKQ